MAEIELIEPRALSVRAGLWVTLAIATLALVSATRFPAQTLWPILAAIAVYTCLFVVLSLTYLARPRRIERIRIEGTALNIQRSQGRSVLSWDWRTPWTWVDMHDDGEDDVRVWLVTGDQRIAIGTHVGPPARREAAGRLKHLLQSTPSRPLRLA